MSIDYERDEQSEREQRGEKVAPQPAPKRHLPVGDLAQGASFLAREEFEEDAKDGLTVTEATRDGFTSGFAGGLSPASAFGAMAQVAEATEQGLTTSTAREDRMDRFPELRDVEVPTGNAARFPELADEPQGAEVHPDTEEELLQR